MFFHCPLPSVRRSCPSVVQGVGQRRGNELGTLYGLAAGQPQQQHADIVRWHTFSTEQSRFVLWGKCGNAEEAHKTSVQDTPCQVCATQAVAHMFELNPDCVLSLALALALSLSLPLSLSPSSGTRFRSPSFRRGSPKQRRVGTSRSANPDFASILKMHYNSASLFPKWRQNLDLRCALPQAKIGAEGQNTSRIQYATI